ATPIIVHYTHTYIYLILTTIDTQLDTSHHAKNPGLLQYLITKSLLVKLEDNLLNLALCLSLTGNVKLNHNLPAYIHLHLFNQRHVLVVLLTHTQSITNVQLLFLLISQLNFLVELTQMTKLLTLTPIIWIFYTQLQSDTLFKPQAHPILLFQQTQFQLSLNPVY